MGRDFDRDAKFKFASNWCLGALVNMSNSNETECQTPAGIAAISYDINPLVLNGIIGYITSPSLNQ